MLINMQYYSVTLDMVWFLQEIVSQKIPSSPSSNSSSWVYVWFKNKYVTIILYYISTVTEIGSTNSFAFA